MKPLGFKKRRVCSCCSYPQAACRAVEKRWIEADIKAWKPLVCTISNPCGSTRCSACFPSESS